jgi:two-component system, cell cycle sensor histidine kinase and response regulator CckA
VSAALRVLLIEDNADDARLVQLELEDAGFAPVIDRVETPEELASAIERGAFDVIISDYRLPRLTAPEALALYRESGRDEPFLVCSGSIGETEAVELMRAGASDFFLKGNLARLGTALTRELREAENRRARRAAEEQHRASVEALRRSEERFRRAVEASPNGIVLIAADGSIVLVNAQVERTFGYAGSELVGQPVEILVPDALRHGQAGQGDDFARDPSGRRMGAAREVPARRKDGTTLPVEIGLSHFDSATGPMVMAVIVDLTERRTLQDRLQRSQRLEAIGRLAGGVAHDFNNLLGVITGFGELAQRQVPADHPVQARLAHILSAAARAADLTRQMLAFSRKQVIHPRALDLNRVVEGVCTMLRRLIGDDVELVLRLAPELGTVLADPTQVEQVVMNLAVNARDAMPEGGTLTFETANVDLDQDYLRGYPNALPGAYVMLAVSDTGVGMDGETQAHIFEPFFTTKPEGKGTGLGLATVYGIVKQSNGFVWVYSEPAHGATFKVYLPRVSATAEDLTLPAAPPEVTHGSETILIVEDQGALRRMIRAALEELGYSVLEAADGPAALDAAETHPGPIDVLLTDVVMPGMSGRTLADALARRRSALRVVYMSGYSDGTVSDRGLLARGVTLVEKPFTIAALAAAIRKALDAR